MLWPTLARPRPRFRSVLSDYCVTERTEIQRVKSVVAQQRVRDGRRPRIPDPVTTYNINAPDPIRTKIKCEQSFVPPQGVGNGSCALRADLVAPFLYRTIPISVHR